MDDDPETHPLHLPFLLIQYLGIGLLLGPLFVHFLGLYRFSTTQFGFLVVLGAILGFVGTLKLNAIRSEVSKAGEGPADQWEPHGNARQADRPGAVHPPRPPEIPEK
jgi:hypothetical protein